LYHFSVDRGLVPYVSTSKSRTNEVVGEDVVTHLPNLKHLIHLEFYFFSHSRCSSSFSESFGFGTINQHTMVTTISDTKIGCRTHTPMLVLSSPVTIGKTEPPICAKTKTRDNAVDFVSEVNNREPTDMAWGVVSLKRSFDDEKFDDGDLRQQKEGLRRSRRR
jgi:hypothetical protein